LYRAIQIKHQAVQCACSTTDPMSSGPVYYYLFERRVAPCLILIKPQGGVRQENRAIFHPFLLASLKLAINLLVCESRGAAVAIVVLLNDQWNG
jgi:hypothetical protein